MIINLLPKPTEMIEQSIMINESYRGLGYKCSVLVPKNIELPKFGYQQDVRYDESARFDSYVAVDANPKPKLLNQLGWNTESNETDPMVFYIARYQQDINEYRDVGTNVREVVPSIYTRFLFDYDYFNKGKEFIVTKVNGNSFNPVYYIMAVSPYEPAVADNPDPLNDPNLDKIRVQDTDTNLRFLKVSRGPEVGIKY